MRNANSFALTYLHDDDDHSELSALLHPAGAFSHPQDVVHDPDLTPAEKRAILSSWAAKICVVRVVPIGARRMGTPEVTFDDVADALHQLHRMRIGRGRPQPRHPQVSAQFMPGMLSPRPNFRGRTSIN